MQRVGIGVLEFLTLLAVAHLLGIVRYRDAVAFEIDGQPVGDSTLPFVAVVCHDANLDRRIRLPTCLFVTVAPYLRFRGFQLRVVSGLGCL
jgi:hypothetical protein